MKMFIIITAVLLLLSCNAQDKKGNSNENLNYNMELIENDKTIQEKDTLFYYYPNDYTEYSFDTLIFGTHYFMKFFCLNDSLVFNKTSTDKRKENKNLIELAVAHNYVADFIVQKDGHEFKTRLTKLQFKGSLSDDFLRIATIWKNRFEYTIDNKPIFRATIAQPDTDYQYSVLYYVFENGRLELIKVEDESYDGSDD